MSPLWQNDMLSNYLWQLSGNKAISYDNMEKTNSLTLVILHNLHKYKYAHTTCTRYSPQGKHREIPKRNDKNWFCAVQPFELWCVHRVYLTELTVNYRGERLALCLVLQLEATPCNKSPVIPELGPCYDLYTTAQQNAFEDVVCEMVAICVGLNVSFKYRLHYTGNSQCWSFFVSIFSNWNSTDHQYDYRIWS